jgi:hypothetical protein
MNTDAFGKQVATIRVTDQQSVPTVLPLPRLPSSEKGSRRNRILRTTSKHPLAVKELALTFLRMRSEVRRAEGRKRCLCAGQIPYLMQSIQATRPRLHSLDRPRKAHLQATSATKVPALPFTHLNAVVVRRTAIATDHQ